MTKCVCQALMGRGACSAAAVPMARPATTSPESVAVLLDLLETAVKRLVFQECLDKTVIRFASAQRPTSSATRCPDCVTAPQVSKALNVI